MHTDDAYPIVVLVLEVAQVRQLIDAIDAVVGPEIDQDNTPAQRLKRWWHVGIDSIQFLRRCRSGDSRVHVAKTLSFFRYYAPSRSAPAALARHCAPIGSHV